MKGVKKVFLLVALSYTIVSCHAGDLSVEYLAERMNALEKQGILQTELLQNQTLELRDSKLRLQRQEQLTAEYMKKVKELEQDEAKKHADIIHRISNLIGPDGTEKDALLFSGSRGGELDSNLKSISTKGSSIQTESTRNDPFPFCTYAAFHAVLAEESIPFIGDYNILIFPNVTTNVCDGYNETDGVFTAPREGIYVFSVSIASRNRTSSNVYVMKQGQPIAGAFGEAGGHYEQGSVTVVTEVAAKETVWISLTNTSQFKSVYGLGYTSFTGFLVAP